MIKSVSNLPIINTPKGLGVLEKIYISELNFLMIRVDNMDGTFTTYNLGKHNPDDNFISEQILEKEPILETKI